MPDRFWCLLVIIASLAQWIPPPAPRAHKYVGGILGGCLVTRKGDDLACPFGHVPGPWVPFTSPVCGTSLQGSGNHSSLSWDFIGSNGCSWNFLSSNSMPGLMPWLISYFRLRQGWISLASENQCPFPASKVWWSLIVYFFPEFPICINLRTQIGQCTWGRGLAHMTLRLCSTISSHDPASVQASGSHIPLWAASRRNTA